MAAGLIHSLTGSSPRKIPPRPSAGLPQKVASPGNQPPLLTDPPSRYPRIPPANVGTRLTETGETSAPVGTERPPLPRLFPRRFRGTLPPHSTLCGIRQAPPSYYTIRLPRHTFFLWKTTHPFPVLPATPATSRSSSLLLLAHAPLPVAGPASPPLLPVPARLPTALPLRVLVPARPPFSCPGADASPGATPLLLSRRGSESRRECPTPVPRCSLSRRKSQSRRESSTPVPWCLLVPARVPYSCPTVYPSPGGSPLLPSKSRREFHCPGASPIVPARVPVLALVPGVTPCPGATLCCSSQLPAQVTKSEFSVK